MAKKKEDTTGTPKTRAPKTPCEVVAARVNDDGSMTPIGSTFTKPSTARADIIQRLNDGTLEPGKFAFLTKRGDISAAVKEIPATKELVLS